MRKLFYVCIWLGLLIQLAVNMIFYFEVDNLRNKNMDLEVAYEIQNYKLMMADQEHNRDMFYKRHYDNVSERISKIWSAGYKPDKLLVDVIIRRSYIFKSVNVDTLFQFAKKESSFGSDRRRGVFGEEGWAQFTEATLKKQIEFFGGSSKDFNMKNYSDIVTQTEWVYATYIYARMHKTDGGKVNWANDWNRGKH